jgi:hypothetical protein
LSTFFELVLYILLLKEMGFHSRRAGGNTRGGGGGFRGGRGRGSFRGGGKRTGDSFNQRQPSGTYNTAQFANSSTQNRQEQRPQNVDYDGDDGNEPATNSNQSKRLRTTDEQVRYVAVIVLLLMLSVDLAKKQLPLRMCVD